MAKIYMADGAHAVGDVALGENVNIWYGAVLRGDAGQITVDAGTNIQDNCVLHEKTTVGKDCTVGHGAILHGCTVGDRCLIGMGAIVLNGARLGVECMVGAGALVIGKTDAPDGSLLLGSPAKVVRPLTPDERQQLLADARHYVETAEKTLPILEW